MTHLAPRRTHLRAVQHRPGWRRAALLAGLSLLVASSAQAQTIVGGNRAPAVSVDLTVLDRLGSAPNLPQLFSASRPPAAGTAPMAAAPRPAARAAPQVALEAPTASKKKRPATQRVAQHKSPADRNRLAGAPVADRSIHLISPAAQAASGPRVTPPIQPASAAIAAPVPAPAPMPKLPQSDAAPAPPVLSPAPAHDDAPSPPPQPPVQAHGDNAPVPLAASPPAPAPAQTAAADSQTVSTTNNAMAATSRPAQVQVASAASMGSVVNTVKFAAGTTDLPSNSKSVLDTVAAKLVADDALRVQLVAHATGGADQAMEARRVSLARAIAVRAYLIDKGVRSLRMDVRALGNRSDDGPAADQVDLLIVSQ